MSSSYARGKSALPAPTEIGAAWTLNEAIEQYPAALDVFFELGIDTCWGERETIAGAARDANVSLDELLSGIAASIAPPRRAS